MILRLDRDQVFVLVLDLGAGNGAGSLDMARGWHVALGEPLDASKSGGFKRGLYW